jgi:dTDP-4-dehydrorhamnose reductase
MASGAEAQLRVVVTGGRGRLGAALCREYGERHEVIPLSRKEMCLSDPKTVGKVVEAIDFDVLINTAAYTTVDECERDRELAYAINAHAAASMAQVCRDKGARMIQLSTDFVFDGTADAPYSEGDVTNPINVYGQSKLLGEAKVLSALDDALVARVSWVFGPDKPGFPAWLIGQVRENAVVGVPGDKVACPTYSLDFAEMLEPLLRGGLPKGKVLHMCNSGQVSWFDYASFIVGELRARGEKLALQELVSTNSDGVQQFVARRPLRTGLAVDLFASHTGGDAPDWQSAMRRHLDGLDA